jgi:hypothetical protein
MIRDGRTVTSVVPKSFAHARTKGPRTALSIFLAFTSLTLTPLLPPCFVLVVLGLCIQPDLPRKELWTFRKVGFKNQQAGLKRKFCCCLLDKADLKLLSSSDPLASVSLVAVVPAKKVLIPPNSHAE